MIEAWGCEADTADECAWTPWADHGWPAWNGMSPEREFCELASTLARMTQPAVTIETGVGQGYTTRRLAAALRGRLVCFESDPEWRAELRALPFFDGHARQLSERIAPEGEDFAAAQLSILDSDPPLRMEELELWHGYAPSGAVLLVHDCGNGHGFGTPHWALRQRVECLGIPGTFLANPRGGFLGVHV